jgi:hypothetical protein
MAYILNHSDRPLDAKRALAAAQAFDLAAGVEPAKNPFAEAIFERSVFSFLEARLLRQKASEEELVTDRSKIEDYINPEDLS